MGERDEVREGGEQKIKEVYKTVYYNFSGTFIILQKYLLVKDPWV